MQLLLSVTFLANSRTWSIKNGVMFATMAGLLGVSAMAEALLKDPEQMTSVKKSKQVRIN